MSLTQKLAALGQVQFTALQAGLQQTAEQLQAVTTQAEAAEQRVQTLAKVGATANFFKPVTQGMTGAIDSFTAAVQHLEKVADSGNQTLIDKQKELYKTQQSNSQKIIDDYQANLDKLTKDYQKLVEKIKPATDKQIAARELGGLAGSTLEDAAVTKANLDAENFYNQYIKPLKADIERERLEIANYDQLIRSLDKTTKTAATTESQTGPAKTYEIKFTTATGQTETLTTTQDPEDFLTALEAAQRRSL